MQFDIFVSYRRSDREFVAAVVRRLEARGVGVWYDADIEGGADWRETIVDALTNSDMLAIFFSEECNTSRQLKKELAVANSLEKPVVPILIENTQPKGAYLYELADRNWIQVFPDPMSRIDELVQHLTVLAGKSHGGLAGARPMDVLKGAPVGGMGRQRDGAAPSAPAAANDDVLEQAAPAPPPREAYVGKVSQGGKKVPTNDILPFKLVDLFVLVPWLVLSVWRTIESLPVFGTVPGIALGGALFLVGVALFGSLVFPVRYFLRGRSVVSALVSFAVSTLILFVLAGASYFGPDLAAGNMPANLVMDINQIGLTWVAFTVVAFLIYGVLSAQRALRSFKSNIRKI